ncbi:MAG: ECF-type sigma factor [Planctomycetota bacterium]|jgi:RNA polymerase sigma factor (TIGR02999 family)
MSDVTRILNAIEQGDANAADELLPLVYEELRLLAAHRLSQEPPGQTLQATALVHEAYLRLVGTEDQAWDNKGHFFKAAAEAMRRIVIENARHKKSLKHGSGWQRVCIEGLEAPFESSPEDLVALDESLSKMAESEPEIAMLVKLRYFAGMTIEQIAQIAGVSDRTVFSNLAYARAWLHREIVKEGRHT